MLYLQHAQYKIIFFDINYCYTFGNVIRKPVFLIINTKRDK